MNRRRIFALLLICALLLPLWVQGARVMGGDEQAETPVGDEVHAAGKGTVSAPAPEKAAEAPQSAGARLTDVTHTAAEHATVLSGPDTLADGNYYLTGDITGDITVPSGVTASLCLNGHTVTGSGTGSVITVNNGAALTLCDCVGGGKVTGGVTNSQGGGVNVNGGTLYLKGGSITGNSAPNGGGVRVGQNSRLVMTGGSIDHNEATIQYAGGVFVLGGTFELQGGTVSGNTAAKNGGGVALVNGGAMSMSGGTISGNTATAADGGGVYFFNNGTFTMSGGSITGNTAAEHGGGVYCGAGEVTMTSGSVSNNTAQTGGGGVYVPASSTFSVSGDPVVAGNTSGAARNNIELTPDKDVVLIGVLTSGASLGVTKAGAPTFAAGEEYIASSDPSAFFCDDDDYAVGFDEDGQLCFGVGITYSVPAGVSGTAPVDNRVYPKDETVEVETTCPLTKEGYAQIGWTDDPTSAVAIRSVTMRGNRTLYPVFARKFTSAARAATIDLTYNTVIDPQVDLNDYVQFADGVVDTEKNFTFSVAEGSALPAGLNLLNGKTISGATKANRGNHTVTFDVRDNQSATLFAMTPDPAHGAAKLTLTFSVARATPTEDEFDFEPPEDLVADGTAKAATVTPVEEISGMGDITVKYSSDGGQSYQTTAPTEPGIYKVAVDVTTDGTNYLRATDITDDDWTFTIAARPLTIPTAADFTFTPPSDRVWNGSAKAAAVAVKSGVTGMGAITVKYALSGSSNYAETVPTAPGIYQVAIDVALGDSYSNKNTLTDSSWTFTIDKATLTPADFVFTAPTELKEDGTPKAATVVPRNGITADIGTISVKYTQNNGASYTTQPPTEAGTYKVVIDVTVGTNYAKADNLTDAGWSFIILDPDESLSIDYQTLQGKNGVVLTIAGTLDPDAVIVAVKLTNGAMTDLAWGGVRNGNTVTFDGKDLTQETSDWKILFLGSNASLLPLCEAVELR